MRAIADEVGAYLVADVAHYAGLIVAGLYPNPMPYAHVVTSTTHKTLRGPRGGIILTNDEALFKKINKAVFPGVQGGPLMHVIAGKAAAFYEALQPSFKAYAQSVIDNAKALSATLAAGGLRIVSGGTDSHLVLVDLRPIDLNGKEAVEELERYNLTANKNALPFDTRPPSITSGIRLGSPAGTSRGFGSKEFEEVGELILKVLHNLREGRGESSDVHARVRRLTTNFPILGGNYD